MLSDDPRPLTVWRALRAPEFYLLLTGYIAAVGGVSAWVVVPLLIAGLSISNSAKFIAPWPGARRVKRAWWRTFALSMLNSLVASCGVFLLGIVARWLWS